MYFTNYYFPIEVAKLIMIIDPPPLPPAGAGGQDTWRRVVATVRCWSVTMRVKGAGT